MTDESASSIGFRRGGLGPAEFARVNVEDGGRIATDSITLLSRDVRDMGDREGAVRRDCKVNRYEYAQLSEQQMVN